MRASDFLSGMIGEDDDDDEIGCLPLSPPTLHGLERNEFPFVDGLLVSRSNWIERAAHIIGSHKTLRSIHIDMSYTSALAGGDPNWLENSVYAVSRNRSIVTLILEGDSDMGLDIFHILMPFFEKNLELQHIELHQFDFSRIVFHSFVSALNKCGGFTSLVHISLCDINCSDEQAAVMFEVLTGWRNLHYLCFSENEGVGVKGCTTLSKLLTNPACQVSGFIFSNNDLNDECMAILGKALKINSTVKIIELSGNENATALGWYSCFSNMFSHPTCSISRLTLLESELTDDDVISLGNSLVGNKTIQLLDLYANTSITLIGWQGLLNCLRTSNLEHLNVGACNIDDATARMIVTALADNSSLKELVMHETNYVTTALWDDLYWVLCDETSIDSTYSSNHSLETFWLRPYLHPDNDVPDFLLPLLEMNRDEDKSRVARQKLFKYHFFEGGDNSDIEYQISVFAQMSKVVMPYAIEWIGRDNSLTFLFKLKYRCKKTKDVLNNFF